LAIIRLTRHDTAIDSVSLAARLDRIEGRLRREGTASRVELPAATAPAPSAPAPSPPASKQAERASAPAADAPFEKPAAPPAGPEAAPTAPMKDEMAAAELSMKAVESAWPALVGKVREAVGPRRYALLKEATPGIANDDKLVLHVPPHLTFHLESLQEDAALREVVEMAASDLLGGRVHVSYQPGPGGGGAAVVQQSIPETPARAPAPGDLVEESEGGIDPTKLVEDILGGEVVDPGQS
jgi:hypothetical protein